MLQYNCVNADLKPEMSVNNQDNDTNGSKVRNVDHLNRLQVLFVNRICNFHLQWNSVFFM